jgi:hypothetical protein
LHRGELYIADVPSARAVRNESAHIGIGIVIGIAIKIRKSDYDCDGDTDSDTDGLMDPEG